MGLLDADTVKATPRNQWLGLLADALSSARDYANKSDPAMPGGRANPVLSLLSDAVGLPAVATTADRMSYGEPLTNIGKANVPLIRPETADAAMAVAPFAPMLGRAAMGTAKMVAPATAQMADDYLMRSGLAPQMVVYHGSPHKFDKFDSSKIGTGEGAQAYGHGLYLAESPDVAKQYSTALSDAAKLTPDGMAARALSSADDLIAAKQALYRQYNEATSPAMQNAALKAIEVLNSGKTKAPQLYKVDLPDDKIARMLDWDKPLSQQAPEVQAAVKQTDWYKHAAEVANGPNGRLFVHPDDRTGAEFYKMMADADKQSANVLRAQGIPGIRYLDGGSRGAGAGTSNFVVFPGEENALKILERNGKGLLQD